MGSPLTFWKLQQVPVLWRSTAWDSAPGSTTRSATRRSSCRWSGSGALDLARRVLPDGAWSRRLYGPRAMALAAWLFALGPNLLAHGSLATMELPLRRRVDGDLLAVLAVPADERPALFWAAAALGGLGLFVQVHRGPLPADPGPGLVARSLEEPASGGRRGSRSG